MAKRPSPGSTKTRMAPTLTAEAAAELAQCFLLDTIDQVRALADAGSKITPAVAASPAKDREFFAQLAPGFEILAQHGETLGQRLDYVLTRALTSADMAIAMNSDSPSLPTALLEQAVAEIRDPTVDVVLGPAADGGYYLIGVTQPPGQLVAGVEMSTPHVLSDSLSIAAELGLRVALLDPWYDVDEPKDLERLRAEADAGIATGARTKRFLDLHP